MSLHTRLETQASRRKGSDSLKNLCAIIFLLLFHSYNKLKNMFLVTFTYTAKFL